MGRRREWSTWTPASSLGSVGLQDIENGGGGDLLSRLLRAALAASRELLADGTFDDKRLCVIRTLFCQSPIGWEGPAFGLGFFLQAGFRIAKIPADRISTEKTEHWQDDIARPAQTTIQKGSANDRFHRISE